MDQDQVKQWVSRLIAEDNLHEFYTSGQWLKIRAEVLEADKCECQRCKRFGKYERANTVHHVKPIKKFPELALSKTYIDENGQEHRQLISVSSICHGMEDDEHIKLRMARSKPLTEERW